MEIPLSEWKEYEGVPLRERCVCGKRHRARHKVDYCLTRWYEEQAHLFQKDRWLTSKTYSLNELGIDRSQYHYLTDAGRQALEQQLGGFALDECGFLCSVKQRGWGNRHVNPFLSGQRLADGQDYQSFHLVGYGAGRVDLRSRRYSDGQITRKHRHGREDYELLSTYGFPQGYVHLPDELLTRHLESVHANEIDRHRREREHHERRLALISAENERQAMEHKASIENILAQHRVDAAFEVDIQPRSVRIGNYNKRIADILPILEIEDSRVVIRPNTSDYTSSLAQLTWSTDGQVLKVHSSVYHSGTIHTFILFVRRRTRDLLPTSMDHGDIFSVRVNRRYVDMTPDKFSFQLKYGKNKGWRARELLKQGKIVHECA